MRFRFAVAAVVLQVLALAFLGGEREWILRTGRIVLLRTAPIDPSDPMRGDYARLDYEISHVPLSRCEDNLPKLLSSDATGYRTTGRRVYARLQESGDGISDLSTLTDVRPAEGLYIRGLAQHTDGTNVQVRYGIEALFMQQGTARELEDMRVRERPGVPLDIEVAISSAGIAVLKDYHWEPLGLTVTFEREPAAAQPEPNSRGAVRPPQRIKAVDVELKNYGPEDVAIVDLPDAGSLRLVPNERWQEARFRWVGDGRTMPSAEAAHVILLKPGQSHAMKIDLTLPAWFVVSSTPTGDQRPIALRDIPDPWSASFRVEYAPPPKTADSHLPHADLIRHSPLRSRAFNATAGLD